MGTHCYTMSNTLLSACFWMILTGHVATSAVPGVYIASYRVQGEGCDAYCPVQLVPVATCNAQLLCQCVASDAHPIVTTNIRLSTDPKSEALSWPDDDPSAETVRNVADDAEDAAIDWTPDSSEQFHFDDFDDPLMGTFYNY